VTERNATRGFTLVELMIVVGLIGVLAVAIMPALGSISGSNARKAAGELAGSLRYLFDTAALRNQTCRLGLDLDERTTWAECAPGAVGVVREDDRSARQEEDTTDLAERFPDERDAERRRLLAKTRFGGFSDRLVPRRQLPDPVHFGEIRVEGRRDPIAKGVAYVHFFPGGQGQRAFIPIVDGDYKYTVVVEPYTGRTRVVIGLVEDER
jgi:general secretion pathway protein H